MFVSRLGTVIFYNVGDAGASISTGILARATADAPLGERDASGESIETLFVDPIKDRSFKVGFYAWIVALVAVELYRAGASCSQLLLFAPPAYLLTGDHAVLFGSLVFGSFFLGVLWLEFACRAPARAESLLVRSTISNFR